ncbi:hypothetical protein MIN45_P1039 [Methylomarinovum tepidoasis]|uniref:Uncharacterized protein n=1 Tax=Methylomarinovum tepidoasis TaxID=2840183 RepID=A0AAU9BY61_9GAMM|nr:hypothetical protein [Methylomarinovum sp. IN45]BCX88670.1 hypothetical protein MIN45_P1039 [Methylomarinovum sp. IN45]
MSNENENTTPPNEEEGLKEKVEEIKEEVEEKVEEIKEEAEEQAGKLVETLTRLRTEKPLIFYGGIGAVVVVILLLLLLGGGSGVQQVQVPALQVGQTYKLVNPNVTGGGDVLLLQAPGRMGATDPELRAKEQVCVVKSGTPAKLVDQTVVNYVKYAKVEPQAGDCAGKQGWTPVINLKQ